MILQFSLQKKNKEVCFFIYLNVLFVIQLRTYNKRECS